MQINSPTGPSSERKEGSACRRYSCASGCCAFLPGTFLLLGAAVCLLSKISYGPQGDEAGHSGESDAAAARQLATDLPARPPRV
jgi:hypothetical protein